MKQIGLAIIGTGEIAQNFHIPVLKEISSVKITAICDINKSLASALAEKHEIPYFCDSIDELLNNESVEAVDICASTDAHFEIAKKCIEAGKSVFIERPLARNLDEAQMLAELSDKHYVKVMVGMNQRFRSDAIILKNFLNRGEVGDIFYSKAGWMQNRRESKWLENADKAGGGVLIDLGLPIIDSLLWFYDNIPAVSVLASAYYHRTRNVEDVCIATIRFENGSIATFETSWTLFSEKSTFYCDIFGNNGSAKINPVRLYRNDGNHFSPVDNTFTQNNYLIMKKSFESELKHFVNAVLDFTPIISSLHEAVECHRIVDAMYESIREGREIVINR